MDASTPTRPAHPGRMREAPARAPDSNQEKALLGHLLKNIRRDARMDGSRVAHFDAARNLPAGPAEWSPAVVGVGRRLGASTG